MHKPRRLSLLALVLGLALGAGGCGTKSAPGSAQAQAAATAAVKKKAATPADSLSPYLVAAAITAKGGASLLQVKFELGARPQVGDPVDVDLVLVPAADNIERISGTVQGEDGLEILSGATIDAAEKPVFGTPIHHGLKLRAKRDGIFTLSTSLTVESGGQTLTPAYSMPLIAGKGLVDLGAAPAPARNAARPAPGGSTK